MTADRESEGSFRVLPAVAVTVGTMLVVFGALVVPASLLGGLHVAAIGVSVDPAGLVSTR